MNQWAQKRLLVVGRDCYARALAFVLKAAFATEASAPTRRFDSVLLVLSDADNIPSAIKLQKRVFSWPGTDFVSWIFIAPNASLAEELGQTDLSGNVEGKLCLSRWPRNVALCSRHDSLIGIASHVCTLQEVHRGAWERELCKASIVPRLTCVLQGQESAAQKRGTILQELRKCEPINWDIVCCDIPSCVNASRMSPHVYARQIIKWIAEANHVPADVFVSRGLQLLRGKCGS